MFFSGIPPLEKQSNTKWHAVQEYLEYRDDTSPLIPLPRYFYGGLPKIVKRKPVASFPYLLTVTLINTL